MRALLMPLSPSAEAAMRRAQRYAPMSSAKDASRRRAAICTPQREMMRESRTARITRDDAASPPSRLMPCLPPRLPPGL